jgi:hypothetical protein
MHIILFFISANNQVIKLLRTFTPALITRFNPLLFEKKFPLNNCSFSLISIINKLG